MKILYPLGSFFPAQSGGPNNTIYWITEALKKNKIGVYVVTSNMDISKTHNIKLNEWLNLEYANVIYCKTLIHYFPITLIFESIKKIKDVDVIHLTGIFYPPSLIIYLINHFFFKKKVVWSPRGELANEALMYRSKIKYIYLLIIKFFLSNKHYVHTTSDDETLLVKNKLNHSKIIQIPNYIKPENKLVSDNKFEYFLFIGRINPKKAIENLINALKISKLFNSSKFKFLIAGDYKNKYGYSLIALVKKLELSEKVKFVGHVVGAKKSYLYAESYFTFMPSHNENFGNVVVESLCQGTPVVASIGTPWKVLENYNAGYWINNSPENIAKKIDQILSLSELEYNIMRSNSLKLVSKEFNITNKINNWIKFYKNLINQL